MKISCHYCGLLFDRASEIIRHLEEQHLRLAKLDKESKELFEEIEPEEILPDHGETKKLEICESSEIIEKKEAESTEGIVVQSFKVLTKKSRKKERPRNHLCDLCGKSFSQSSELWTHVRFHLGIKPHHCTEPGCDRHFTIIKDLQDHIRKAHTGERPYKCLECGKCFLTGSVYYQHRLIHKGERRYGCSKCDRRFLRSDALKNHYLIHTGEKPWPCMYCPKYFRQKGDLKKHILARHRKKSNSNIGFCKTCSTSFRRTKNFLSHLRGHVTMPLLQIQKLDDKYVREYLDKIIHISYSNNLHNNRDRSTSTNERSTASSQDSNSTPPVNNVEENPKYGMRILRDYKFKQSKSPPLSSRTQPVKMLENMQIPNSSTADIKPIIRENENHYPPVAITTRNPNHVIAPSKVRFLNLPDPIEQPLQKEIKLEEPSTSRQDGLPVIKSVVGGAIKIHGQANSLLPTGQKEQKHDPPIQFYDQITLSLKNLDPEKNPIEI